MTYQAGNNDLGNGHSFSWTVAKAGKFPQVPEEWRNWKSPGQISGPDVSNADAVDLIGIIEWHPKPNPANENDTVCGGGVYFVPNVRENGNPTWTVESLEPLTIAPSVLCGCGTHGFIREGRWVDA